MTHQLGNQNLARAEARFSHSGFRLGADLDLLQWGDSRVGLNADCDLSLPEFTESVFTLEGKRISGEPPVTGGIHFYWNPTRYFLGLSGVLEAKARWPLTGSEVTEWEISAGARGVENSLGSIALKGGYRNTSLRFEDSQAYNGLEVTATFDGVFYGWFLEFVYNY